MAGGAQYGNRTFFFLYSSLSAVVPDIQRVVGCIVHTVVAWRSLAAGRRLGYAESWEFFENKLLASTAQTFFGATPSKLDPAVARATKASPPPSTATAQAKFLIVPTLFKMCPTSCAVHL